MNEPNKDELTSPKNEKTDDSILSGVFSKGLSGAVQKLVTFILFGAVMATGGYLYNKFQTIQESITQHHGPGWEDRIQGLVQVNELKEKLDQLEENTKELQSLNARLDKAQVVFGKWAAQLDRQKAREFNRQVSGWAEMNKRLPEDENACTVNRAHSDGFRYDLGDEVRVTFTTEGNAQTISCIVRSLMEEHEQTNVIVQLNKRMTDQIHGFYDSGRVKVILSLPAAEPQDEHYWYTLAGLAASNQPD